jgi:hypothetical protein
MIARTSDQPILLSLISKFPQAKSAEIINNIPYVFQGDLTSKNKDIAAGKIFSALASNRY